MEKDKWIEEVLRSSEQIRRLTPRESLFEDIKSKVKSEKNSYKIAWLTAACVAVLVLVNIISVNKFIKGGSGQFSDNQTSYNFFINSNQLY